jgi:predicted metal-dependent enzyme (double-stranded beta helix superfamily)
MAYIRPVDLATLGLVARGIARRPELWRAHVIADPGERHYRRLISEPHMSVWMLCWMPGQATGFHDHDGAAGAVTVAAGAICEERLRFADAHVRAEHRAGDVLTFGPDDIHRVTHLEGEPAVTIHAYSPELKRMGSYVEGPGGILMRRAQDEEVELRAGGPVPAFA